MERRRVAVLLAGGTGTRMGAGVPKQLLEVAGRPLLEHSLRVLHAHPVVEEITVVMAARHLPAVTELVRAGGYDKVVAILEGGTSRGESTVAALATLGEQPCDVLVHDAARPLLTPQMIGECFTALASYAAVTVAIASTDTVVTVDEAGLLRDTLPRASLRRVQTPQAFRLEVLREAHARASAEGDLTATDDCGVVRRHLPEHPVAVVAGDERNLKVTSPTDLVVADALLRAGVGD